MAESGFPPTPGTNPRSSAPTRAAAVCSTLNPCHSAVSAPASRAKPHAAANTPAPPRKAPCPTITIGRFAARNASPNAPVSSPTTVPRCSCAYVRSATGPKLPTGHPPSAQRLRIRAFSTGASRRGLHPISRIASASSIPAIPELNV